VIIPIPARAPSVGWKVDKGGLAPYSVYQLRGRVDKGGLAPYGGGRVVWLNYRFFAEPVGSGISSLTVVAFFRPKVAKTLGKKMEDGCRSRRTRVQISVSTLKPFYRRLSYENYDI